LRAEARKNVVGGKLSLCNAHGLQRIAVRRWPEKGKGQLIHILIDIDRFAARCRFPPDPPVLSLNLFNASSNCFSSGGITRFFRFMAAGEFCIAW